MCMLCVCMSVCVFVVHPLCCEHSGLNIQCAYGSVGTAYCFERSTIRQSLTYASIGAFAAHEQCVHTHQPCTLHTCCGRTHSQHAHRNVDHRPIDPITVRIVMVIEGNYDYS